MLPTEPRGPAGVVRTALRPRMLALLVLALGLAVVFAELGSWQLGRSRTAQQAPPEREVVPLQQVLAPQERLTAEAVAGPVAVRGTWADVPQQLVVDRRADGAPGDGAWVLAAVEVPDEPAASPGETGTGAVALLPVVRGWVPDAAAAPPPPAGPAELVGELEVSEDPRGLAGLPAGQLSAASSADLLNVWDGRVYAGYLVPEQQAPGAQVVPPPEREAGTNLQNVSYAFQWWVFAGFAVLMWLRVVHDVHRRALERAEDEAEERAAGQPPATVSGPGPADDRPADDRPADRRAQEASR